jgi:hypothetical protein
MSTSVDALDALDDASGTTDHRAEQLRKAADLADVLEANSSSSLSPELGVRSWPPLAELIADPGRTVLGTIADPWWVSVPEWGCTATGLEGFG